MVEKCYLSNDGWTREEEIIYEERLITVQASFFFENYYMVGTSNVFLNVSNVLRYNGLKDDKSINCQNFGEKWKEKKRKEKKRKEKKRKEKEIKKKFDIF